jgi:hypothetical protein
MRLCIALGCCLLAAAGASQAQNRKPGLWEMTTTMTYQQSIPGMAGSSMNTGAHTTPVCLTQALIDKYGAPVPAVGRNCTLTNLNRKANSMTADIVCTGRMAGKGTAESSWTADKATGKVHYVGTIATGPDAKTIEWTTTSTSVFKSADCGSVKPFVNPE